jgi:hypothetical protein
MERCNDCGLSIPKRKYSKRFSLFLCTKCRKHREWVRMIDLSNAREFRRERKEAERIKRLETKQGGIK